MTDKPIPCPVCSHPSVSAINQAIVNGKSMRGIARDFRLGRVDDDGQFHEDHNKVRRHIKRCMPEAYAEATKARKVDEGNAIMRRMDELDEAVNEVLNRARKGTPELDEDGIPKLDDEGRPKVTYPNHLILAAVVQGRRNADLRARLAGTEPDADDGALERQRELLENPEARKLLAELERMAADGDQTVQ